jgi:hypothetical protein
MSHVMSMLGADMAAPPDATPQLRGVPIPDDINMLLYPYQTLMFSGSLDALKSSSEGGEGVPIVIQNDCPLHDLKNCIIKFLHGNKHGRLSKHSFTQLYENLKLWYFDPATGLWSRLQTKKDWSHVKTLSISAAASIKLMYHDCIADDGNDRSGQDRDTNKSRTDVSISDESSVQQQQLQQHPKCGSSNGSPRSLLKMSLLDQLRDDSAGSRQTPAQKQQIMAERLEQRLLLSRRL